MHITHKDLKKYFIFATFVLWLILGLHLFYLYVESLSKPVPAKGGVLLEGVVNQPVNPLPYLGNNYYSKYIQSLLFVSCLSDSGKTQLCEVNTKDRKTFTLKIKKGFYWSDGRQITADDVFFTYNDIIKNNSLGFQKPIPNTLTDVKKIDNDTVEVTFSDATVNNWSFFKNYILPAHILKDTTKQLYAKKYLENFVNASCVKVVKAENTNLVLDYKNCKDYYFDKYQFKLLPNFQDLKKYLTGSIKIDIYNGYENIDPAKFTGYDVVLPIRYALFWNTKKQTNSAVKAYLSEQIIKSLKNNVYLSSRLKFNGYGLFVLPKVNLDKTGFVNLIKKSLLQEQENQYLKKLILLTGDVLIWKEGSGQVYYKKTSIKDKLEIRGILLTGNYDKIGIQANSGTIYYLRSYAGGKTFKYFVSEKFKNIKIGKNVYSVYSVKNGKHKLLGKITLYYKKLQINPGKNIKIPDFKIVYLNKGITASLGDAVSAVIKSIYPGKVIAKKVQQPEYEELLNSGDYDLVISNINFVGKDISYLFLSNDPLSNPSLFVNPNFASLIKQDLLVGVDMKKKIFAQLNQIYQQYLPVVILGSEKFILYVNKKYHIPNLDYSLFDNRKKMLKYIVLNYFKKPVLSEISLKGFYQFLISKINDSRKASK